MPIHNLLPTPFYSEELKVDRLKVLKTLQTACFRPTQNGMSQTGFDLHLRPEFAFLVSEIEQSYVKYIDEIKFEPHPFKVIGMWSNYYFNKGIHNHTHPNSYVSGVYCVQQGSQSSTVFSSPISTILRREKDFIEPTSVELLEGAVLMFPSFVPHFSEPAQDRITISFNIMPQKLGCKNSHNYFEWE